MQPRTLLIVEDEPDLREVLRLTFENEGYRVLEAADGQAALEQAREAGPDAMILDLMLPGKDGFEVCQEIRRDPRLSYLPILILSAKSEESDVVLGLGVGADDYVVKPFRPKELAARVRSMLRRSRVPKESTGEAVQVIGDLVIDPVRFEVRTGEVTVQLTPSEFRLLQTLASHPGRVYRRAELLDRVSGAMGVAMERTIDSHIKSLRRKLEIAGDCIQTVRGVGYRFEDPKA